MVCTYTELGRIAGVIYFVRILLGSACQMYVCLLPRACDLYLMI